MQFVPDDCLAAISLCESAYDAGAMLPHSLRQIRCNAHIDRPISTACHDIDRGPLHDPVASGTAWQFAVIARSQRVPAKRGPMTGSTTKQSRGGETGLLPLRYVRDRNDET